MADLLQKFNLKKAAIQKALGNLSDKGKMSFKEYGKQKIHLTLILTMQNCSKSWMSRRELLVRLRAVCSICGRYVFQRKIRTLESNLALQQIRDKEAKLRKGVNYAWAFEVKEMEDKLVKLRKGVTLVRPEERKAIEEMYSEKLSQWRKRMFKDVWGGITENSPQDLKEFKEELGLEYDEDVSVSLQSFSDLLQRCKNRARGQ
ncbi:hypothetical protein NC653_025351 [Populus alba x Populus x berolinensis]|uniref:Homologous-pairing protein 2 homolog n=1 Tax=Populus alba x Populus x berolinensis TaxID=444605 RepID=A0AAD6MBC7_9ROSI|nr:hypothetical protein NC653_025351 [Populus alba x Populus x berolinensis]